MRDKFGRFIKGNIPWHKGTKGIKKATSGSFKKGQSKSKNAYSFPKGHKSGMAGKFHSEKTKQKMKNRPKRFGNKAPGWKDGKIKYCGYILIYNPKHPFCTKKGYVLEHRLVMEKKLRRYLTKKEVVHHINGIKDDNRIENLKLFKNESEHTKFHNAKLYGSVPKNY